jgi:hypothetical protein
MSSSHPTVRQPVTHRRCQNIGMEDDALMPASDARHQQSDDSSISFGLAHDESTPTRSSPQSYFDYSLPNSERYQRIDYV